MFLLLLERKVGRVSIIILVCFFQMRLFGMNSFNKIEAAVFPCRLCFLGAFPFMSLIATKAKSVRYISQQKKKESKSLSYLYMVGLSEYTLFLEPNVFLWNRYIPSLYNVNS